MPSASVGSHIKLSGQGRKSTVLQKVLCIICVLSLVVAIVTDTFSLLLTPAPTRTFASWYVEDDISPMPHDYLMEIACQTLSYCNGNADADLPLGTDDRTSFTPDVIGHLDDVTVFFTGMKAAAAISTALFIAFMLVLRRTCRLEGGGGRDHGVYLRMSSKVLLAAVIAVAVLAAFIACAAAIDFNSIFNALHSLFFTSGSWEFPYDSLLICSLPENFWIAMGVPWAAMVVAVIVVLVIVSLLLRRRGKRYASR